MGIQKKSNFILCNVDVYSTENVTQFVFICFVHEIVTVFIERQNKNKRLMEWQLIFIFLKLDTF